MNFNKQAIVIGDGFLGNSFRKAGFQVVKKDVDADLGILSPFRYIINTVGLTDIKKCETERVEAHYLNTLFPEMLRFFCEKNNKKLIHISSAYVYGCADKRASEDDREIPRSFYGMTKLMGDELVKKSSLVLRGNLFYSEYDHPRNLFNKIKNFENFVMETSSLTCCESIVKAAEILKDQAGIFNVSDDIKSIWSVSRIMGIRTGAPCFGSNVGATPRVVMSCKFDLPKLPVEKVFEKYSLNLTRKV